MNPKCGIGDHAGLELERPAVQWIMELCGFPVEGSAGVFVSGGSQANFTCFQAARQLAAQGVGWGGGAARGQGMDRPSVLSPTQPGPFLLRKAVAGGGWARDTLPTLPSTP